MIIEIFQLSFRLFVCAFCRRSLNFLVRIFPFFSPYFLLLYDDSCMNCQPEKDFSFATSTSSRVLVEFNCDFSTLSSPVILFDTLSTFIDMKHVPGKILAFMYEEYVGYRLVTRNECSVQHHQESAR